MVSRRGVLVGAAASGALAGCTEQREPAPAKFQPDSWASVREQFPLDPKLAQFAAFILASHPRPVAEAIARHRRELDADPEGYLQGRTARDGKAREAVAGYLGAEPEDVALTNSTTHGLGTFYTGLRLEPGEEILTTEHDFYATHESLRLRAERTGAKLRRVRLYRDPAKASTDEIVDNLAGALRPRTRAVALTWVHSGTGVKLPIRELAKAIDGRALLCVDGVHGFGAEDVDVTDLGCDVLISGCHKWLFGPRGTGMIWANARGWKRFTPVVPTFDRDHRGPGALASPGGYQAYEHRWSLPEAVAFHDKIGRDRIARRITTLAGELKAGLSELDNIRLMTPESPELSAGIVCCQTLNTGPSDAVARLRKAGVSASVTPYDEPYLRFGTSIATGSDDIEKAVSAVRDLG